MTAIIAYIPALIILKDRVEFTILVLSETLLISKHIYEVLLTCYNWAIIVVWADTFGEPVAFMILFYFVLTHRDWLCFRLPSDTVV